MELLPFDDGQMGQFVDGFFAGEPAAGKDMREMLRRMPQVRGMAQIPLLLGFLCALYRDQRKETSKPRDWNLVRRTDLYEECTERLLSGAWRDKDKESPREMIRRKLRFATHLAYRLFVQSKEQFSWEELAATIQAIWRWPAGPLPEDKEEQVHDRITELSAKDGLLEEAGARKKAPYLFLHLTFQEYLTACHLARLINERGWDKAMVPIDGREVPAKQFLDRKAWLPNWQEVIVLLAGNLKDPVPLLELLADESKDDLFHHRLALAALCLPEIKALMEGPCTNRL
jgi:hypothetical protein